MYLTRAEAKAFFNLPTNLLENGIKAYYADDLSLFNQANNLLILAVKRAQNWRKEIQRELTLSAYDLEPTRGEACIFHMQATKPNSKNGYKNSSFASSCRKKS